MRFYAIADGISNAEGKIIVQMFSDTKIRLKKLRYIFFSTVWDMVFLENEYNDAVYSNGSLVVRLNFEYNQIQITSYADYLKGLEDGYFGTSNVIEKYNIYNMSK